MTKATMRAWACIGLLSLSLALCGCGAESQPRYTTDREAALIGVARETALAQGWTLENCIYSVRREGNGWIVQGDRAPGYDGDAEPSVVVDGTFFVHFDSEGKPTRLLSYGADIRLGP